MPKRIMLTTTTCDNKYLDVMKVFLYTLNLYCNERTLLKADLINGNINIFNRLRRLYENLLINPICLPEGRDWLHRDNMILLMRSRIPTMWTTMGEGWDQILTIDSDTIIRRPMDGIWDDVQPNTIKIWVKEKKRSGSFTKVQAGVHIFGNSFAIRNYYRDFMDKLGDDWEFKEGQAMIYTVYEAHRGKICYIQMPKKYNDSEFKDGSVIWHCKHGHFDDPKFQKEFQHYLHLANEIYNA